MSRDLLEQLLLFLVQERDYVLELELKATLLLGVMLLYSLLFALHSFNTFLRLLRKNVALRENLLQQPIAHPTLSVHV